jgi:hypothetical protein
MPAGTKTTIQSDLAVCGDNFSTNHGCAATNAAGENLSPVGNDKLTSISSDELAVCVIMVWPVIRTNHQKQPVNDSEYVSGLNVTNSVPDISLNLYMSATAAKQEAALALPARPCEKLTGILQPHFTSIGKPGETFRVAKRYIYRVLNDICVARPDKRNGAIQKGCSSVCPCCAFEN